jgi:hypothetical protein
MGMVVLKILRFIGGVLGLLAVAVSAGCKPVSPYLYVLNVDLAESTSVTSDSVHFPSSHWVAAVFSPEDFQRLAASDMANLETKSRYSISSGANLQLVPFNESFKRGNTLPANTIYLFDVVGPGDAKFTIDFSDAHLPVKTFRVVVIKDPAALKDPRVRW